MALTKKEISTAAGFSLNFTKDYYENAQRHIQQFYEYSHKTKEELEEIFNTGAFNDIVQGYLTLTLQEQGKDAEEIRNARETLTELFNNVRAEQAIKAYKNS